MRHRNTSKRRGQNHQGQHRGGQLIETLEARQFLSAAQISFPNFASTSNLTFNGYTGAATTTNNALQLTDGITHEARSVLDDTRVPIYSFTAHFSYQVAQGTQVGSDGLMEADGMTFIIDNGSTTDLGGPGSDLGYQGGAFGANSVGIEFNLFNSDNFGSTIGFSNGAVQPVGVPPAGSVDFHSGDVINATVTYSSGDLSITVNDPTANTSYTASELINLPQVLNSQTALVGFSGGTGNDESVQTIKSFDFTGTPQVVPPTITAAASSSPSPISAKTGTLTVGASSNENGTLSYAWSVVHVPSGAKTPTLTPSGSNSSPSTAVTYYKAGTYVFRVTVTDSNGGSSVSDVAVVVKQTASSIKIAPHAKVIAKKATQQFTASVLDQFKHPLATQPALTFAIVTGGGSINASTGLYSAGATAGHLLVSAEGDGFTGTAGETVFG